MPSTKVRLTGVGLAIGCWYRITNQLIRLRLLR